MTTFLLVRHAEHALGPGVLAGRMPVGLSEEGRRQAAAVAERLAARPLTGICASPRPRAVETADAIARRHGLLVRTIDEVDELDYGDWTGRAIADLDGDDRWQAWNAARATASIPNGETMIGAQRRVVAGLRRLAEHSGDGAVVVVTHADIVRAAVLHALGTSLDDFLAVDVDCASITEVALGDGDASVGAINDTTHLRRRAERAAG